jgi:hypothetical protein
VGDPLLVVKDFNVTTAASVSHVVATWQHVEVKTFDGEFLGYQIKWSQISLGAQVLLSPKEMLRDILPGFNRTSFHLPPGSKFQFQIAVKNQFGCGPFSRVFFAGK